MARPKKQTAAELNAAILTEEAAIATERAALDQMKADLGALSQQPPTPESDPDAPADGEQEKIEDIADHAGDPIPDEQPEDAPEEAEPMVWLTVTSAANSPCVLVVNGAHRRFDLGKAHHVPASFAHAARDAGIEFTVA